MKRLSIPFLLLTWFHGFSQEGMIHSGMMRIYADGGIGLHTNLVNDGIFDGNWGLMGFYSDDEISISGNFVPMLHDMEVMTVNGLNLGISVSVENNQNFILGNINTPRTDSFTTLTFQSDAFYAGAGDIRKVDGYVTFHGQQNFVFPVGDSDQLRPLVIHSEDVNPEAKCAYFFEDPNNTVFFTTNFNTNVKASEIENITTLEFWNLQGSVPSTVQISWNARSSIHRITNNPENIIIVGWNKSTHQWDSLGGVAIGDLVQGFVISNHFVPDDYEVLTFGTINESEIIVDLPNSLLTPNGDGINDFLEISELEQSPNNLVRVYDRNGLLVFKRTNYVNEFEGYATEGDVVINRSKGLPSGVYFYLVNMHDLGTEYQGYLYLAKN